MKIPTAFRFGSSFRAWLRSSGPGSSHHKPWEELFDHNGHVTWAPENSRSLVYDAITDKDGEIRIGGVVIFDLFGADDGCDGTDALSYDAAGDGGLEVEQCSTADSGYGNPLDSNDCTEDFGKEICLTPYQSARTILETGYTNYFDSGTSPRFRCEFVGGVTPYRCDKTSSGGFTRVRQNADFMQLNSSLFFQQVYTDDLAAEGEDINELVTESSDDDGICSVGESTLGNVELPTETRDGNYDSSSIDCLFE